MANFPWHPFRKPEAGRYGGILLENMTKMVSKQVCLTVE